MKQLKNLKILFVSAEVSPFAKTGGLADVAGSLPQALAALSNDVRVVMPKYKIIDTQMSYKTDFRVQVGDRTETCIVREKMVGFDLGNGEMELPVYFIDSYYYFDRDGIYCHYDDGERFAFFCNSILEMLPKIGFKADVIHCNDWHTGPICMLLKEKYNKEPFYSDISTVFTIHNLEYQGLFPKETLKLFDLSYDLFTPEKVEFYGVFNFLKSGLVYSDAISTVSEKYAQEIQTEKHGEALEGLIKNRANDLFGIVNGISYDEFDPLRDEKIYKNYGFETFEVKKENKHLLQKEIGLPVGDMPVFSLVTRLSSQKGLELLIGQLNEFLKKDVQLLILGVGDPYYEDIFKAKMKESPNKIKAFIEFNADLAQKIYAASDVFLMPSKFEPCGLGQIISFRYGTIPIVRETGGLAETVIDIDKDKKNGNGFSFSDFTPDEFYKTVYRAIKEYNKKDGSWDKLVKRALSLDYSWNKPAVKYMNLFNYAIENFNKKSELI